MRVDYSPAARRDLASIGDFIALESPRRARSFVAELRVACQSLVSESLRYPLLPNRRNIRRMPVGNYLVLYQLNAGVVQIVRVIHAARNLDDLTQ